MKCPYCHVPMYKGCCLRCGFMENGVIVNREEKEVTDLEKMLGDSYLPLIRNQNKWTLFFLGPLYLCYRNYFWFGFLLESGELLFLYLFLMFLHSTHFLFLNAISLLPFWIFLYFLVVRILGVYTLNSIYFSLLKSKVKKMNAQEKEEKISNIQTKSYLKVVISILLFVLLYILFVIFLRLF